MCGTDIYYPCILSTEKQSAEHPRQLPTIRNHITILYSSVCPHVALLYMLAHGVQYKGITFLHAKYPAKMYTFILFEL